MVIIYLVPPPLVPNAAHANTDTLFVQFCAQSYKKKSIFANIITKKVQKSVLFCYKRVAATIIAHSAINGAAFTDFSSRRTTPPSLYLFAVLKAEGGVPVWRRKKVPKCDWLRKPRRSLICCTESEVEDKRDLA